jgi:hypothetical protein
VKGFQIDPKVLTIISAVVAIMTLLAQGSVQFPLGVPAHAAAIIVSWDNFLLHIYVVVAPVLIGYSSSQPGPFAPADPPAVKAAMAAAAKTAGILLVGLLFASALALSSPTAARAANAGADEVKVANGPVVRPPSPFVPGTNPASGAGDAGPLSDLADLFASDFAGAASLATETSIKDGNGQACWTAFGPFGEIIKAHPKAFTGKLATDIEAQRLEVIAARNLCNNVACRTVFVEAATAVSKLASTLPVSINVNVTPVDLFAKACADVPTIEVVAPTAIVSPAPTSTPSPTPTVQ